MNLLNEARNHMHREFVVEHIDAKPFFISGIAEGFTNSSSIVGSYSMIFSLFRNGEMEWATLKDEQEKLFGKIVELEIENKGYWDNLLDSWLKDKKIVENTYDELVKKNLRDLTDDEILNDLERIFANHLKTRKISSVIDAFYICAGERLMELLKKKGLGNEAFHTLTSHETESFLNAAKRELAEIGNDIKKLKKHVEKYSWIKTQSFTEGKEYRIEDAIETLKGLKNNACAEENKKKRREFLETNELSEEIAAISDLSVLFTYWTDLRKEVTLRSTYLATRYLREIARRTETEFDALTYLYFPELKQFMQEKISIEEIMKRKGGVVIVFKDDAFKVHQPEEAKDILDKIMKKEAHKVKEIQGMCASKGYAKGKARIIMNLGDMAKIEQGDVLVAFATEPEHLAAMKRASAIVTDVGGVTSHAAIVSRELGIPCIIGTKFATKVLKDGDMVEVDADKGIVKKI